MLLKEGTMLSSVSREVNKRNKEGRRKASNTVAAAFMPGVSEKTSMVSPKKKAHNINSFRDIPELNFRIK
jgi:hypothetical protein